MKSCYLFPCLKVLTFLVEMLAFQWFCAGPVKPNLKRWDACYFSAVLQSEAA